MVTALLVPDMLTDFTSSKLANPAAGQVSGPIGALATHLLRPAAEAGQGKDVTLGGGRADGPHQAIGRR